MLAYSYVLELVDIRRTETSPKNLCNVKEYRRYGDQVWEYSAEASEALLMSL